MSEGSGTGERIYGLLKAAVLAGSLNPHVRLDFVELAEQFGASTTPVREAVMRLIGEGLLEPHSRSGARPSLASEVRLRTLLDLHAKLLLAAVDWAVSTDLLEDAAEPSHEQRTRRLFRDLARQAGNPEFTDVVERLADRLAPFRHREARLIADASAELTTLRAAASAPVQLRRLLRAYHRRRTVLVPQLVWMTNTDVGASRE